MKLMEYLPTQASAPVQPRSEHAPRPQRDGRNSFDNFLNPDRPVERRANSNSSNPRQTRNERPGSNNGRPLVTSPETGRGSSAARTVETAKPEEPVGLPLSYPPDEEAIYEAAGLFGITAQELAAILAGLDADLTEGLYPYQVSKIVQAVYKVENPVELLWQPDAALVTKQLDELIKGYMAKDAEKGPVNAEVKPAEADNKALEDTGRLGSEDAKTAKLPAEAEIIRYEYRRADVFDVKQMEAEAQAKTVANEKAVPVAVSDESAAAYKQGEVNSDSVLAETSVESQKTAEKKGDEFVLNQDAGTATQNGLAQNSQAVDVKQTFVPSGSAADSAEIVKQLTEQVKVIAQPDTTELRLTLKPESLGEVTMRIVSHNGIVTAQLFAETQRIREIIEASLNELKNALTEKGIQVSEMSAFVAEDDKESDQNKGDFGKVISSSRVSRIMRRNGLETAAEIDGEEVSEENTSKNPLEVDYKI